MTTTLVSSFPQARAEQMARPRFADQLDLPAVLTAVNCSRVFTKLTLARWGASAILDDALLITSELVTNAVKATGVMDPNPNWSRLDKLNLIGVRLLGSSLASTRQS
jgi:hypothetical protein